MTYVHNMFHICPNKKFKIEILIFGSQKLIKPKKFKDVTKFHNIFTITLFLVVIGLDLIVYYFMVIYKKLTLW